ncbi:MAG: Uma2 family endonuclease, partial [Acidobacteriota bacterium]|nr:Uma2 family endonuclease [Acidobacteriota bacterium]
MSEASYTAVFRSGEWNRFRLPDVAVVFGAHRGNFLDRGPDLVVEIRLPEDSIASQFRKLDDYFANG